MHTVSLIGHNMKDFAPGKLLYNLAGLPVGKYNLFGRKLEENSLLSRNPQEWQLSAPTTMLNH